jgi:hypothetical protein
MGVSFYRGQQLGREDLNIFLVNVNGTPTNAAEISYALFDFTTGQEVLVGPPRRMPVNSSVGEYYASVVIPLDANLGCYRIRWTFREMVGGPVQQVVQEFEAADKMVSAQTTTFTTCEQGLIRSLRILTRDNNPDRNYHFRPPAHEETVRQYNKVFGFIWEDEEFKEYLERAKDTISLYPPMTPFNSLDQICSQYPQWKTLLITGAMVHALQALRLNWIADEFSLSGDTLVTVILPSGQEIDLAIQDLFGLVKSSVEVVKPLLEIRQAFSQGLLKVKSVASGDIVQVPVSDVLQHHTPHKKAFRLALEDGSDVTTTCDHSLFKPGPNGLPVETRTDSLNVGDSITTLKEGRITSTRIVSMLEVPSLVLSYDLSVPRTENFMLASGILAHNSYSIGGVSLDLDKSSKYESALSTSTEQFDKQIEKAKATVNIIKGLQQPRFGLGVRSSFGPFSARGQLTPRKFVGF